MPSPRGVTEIGVPFAVAATLTPALSARAGIVRGPLYHEGSETHPTPAGYRAIAEEVAAFLRAAAVLGER